MKHYVNYVSIPIDKGTINLMNRPRAIPWTSSSRNEQAYINYYNSFIEATIRIVLNQATGSKVYINLLKPEVCIAEKMDGSMSFIDPQTNQEMALDVSENIINESFYRAALDCCFCNKDKQILDDFAPVWNGMDNFNVEHGVDSDVFKSFTDYLQCEKKDSKLYITWKARIPIRLLSGFAARNAFLLTRNFVCKLYFNEYKNFINSIIVDSVAIPAGDAKILSVDITNLDFYYDQTILGPDEADIFDPSLLNIPSTKIERGYTSVTLGAAGEEKRVKFNDTLNFNPKLMVMFFTNQNDDLVDLKRISPKYWKISTGGETNLNPSYDNESTNEEPDYRLWLQTKAGLDQNNLPCMNYHNWRNASRFYIFSFAENFNLLDNNNYINYELRFAADGNGVVGPNEKINIHRVYLKDYLTVFESITE